FFGLFLPPPLPEPANVLRLMFDPSGLRPYVQDWEAVAEGLVARVLREAVGGVADAETERLLEEVLGYPDVPRRWRVPAAGVAPVPFVTIAFRKGALDFSYFSTVTTLGTPQDITLEEIRIECFHPAAAATAARARRLADAPPRIDDAAGL